jgi:guanylate kinase
LSKAASGNLIVISGPSGSGKSTIIAEAMRRDDRLRFSVSATTRSRRPGEEDGIHYFFVSESDFLENMRKGAFCEYTQIYGNYYGTLRREVERLKGTGCDVVLDIDTSGALQLMNSLEAAVYIFILPPSIQALRSRLQSWGADAPEEIEKRLELAESEMALKDAYDFAIINDGLEAAVERVLSIIQKHRASPLQDRGWGS